MSEDLQLDDELNGAFVLPSKTFKGKPLASYTEGSRLLCLQVKDPEDSSVWFVWSFLYMHLLIAEDRKTAISLAWNKAQYREKLLDWICDKTEDDRMEASNLVGCILEEASKARVEVIPSAVQAPPGKA